MYHTRTLPKASSSKTILRCIEEFKSIHWVSGFTDDLRTDFSSLSELQR